MQVQGSPSRSQNLYIRIIRITHAQYIHIHVVLYNSTQINQVHHKVEYILYSLKFSRLKIFAGQKTAAKKFSSKISSS